MGLLNKSRYFELIHVDLRGELPSTFRWYCGMMSGTVLVGEGLHGATMI